MSMFKWEVVDPAPGEAVAPHQRLAWGKTVGLGAQHVVAMFGATFVFPLVMGLDANLAIMFSGLCTILFLLICQNKVPSYLGTSASFVGSVAAIRALDDRQRLVVRHRRDPGRRPRPRRDRRPRPLRRGLADPPGAAAGGHRRRGHADRLQPGARRRRHLLAPGPVGRPADRHVHGRRRGDAARLLVADRRLPRADLRLPALVGVRRRVRPHHLGAGRRHRGDHPRPGDLVGRARRPTGSDCRAASSPTGSTWSTGRRSR